MQEYVNVSVSSFDPSALAKKLTDKSSEGWEVVAIVPTGGDITAFLKREATGASMSSSEAMASSSSPMAAASPAPEPVVIAAAAAAADPVAEPAGWAVAPEPTPAANPAPATVMQGMNADPTPASSASSSPSGDYGASGGYQSGGYSGAVSSPAAATPAATAPAAASAATPAGWYHDPSGRYELRYWDGSQWTEHVARGGQQYTDPPVA